MVPPYTKWVTTPDFKLSFLASRSPQGSVLGQAITWWTIHPFQLNCHHKKGHLNIFLGVPITKNHGLCRVTQSVVEGHINMSNATACRWLRLRNSPVQHGSLLSHKLNYMYDLHDHFFFRWARVVCGAMLRLTGSISKYLIKAISSGVVFLKRNKDWFVV